MSNQVNIPNDAAYECPWLVAVIAALEGVCPNVHFDGTSEETTTGPFPKFVFGRGQRVYISETIENNNKQSGGCVQDTVLMGIWYKKPRKSRLCFTHWPNDKELTQPIDLSWLWPKSKRYNRAEDDLISIFEAMIGTFETKKGKKKTIRDYLGILEIVDNLSLSAVNLQSNPDVAGVVGEFTVLRSYSKCCKLPEDEEGNPKLDAVCLDELKECIELPKC